MNNLCDADFLNTSCIWSFPHNDHTYCFENQILPWVPYIFLWCFSLFDVYYMFSSQERNIQWSFFNISKLIISSSLIFLSIVDLILQIVPKSNIKNVPVVDLVTSLLKTLSLILAILLLIYNKKYGIRSSGVLFIFWFLLVVCTIPKILTELIKCEKSYDLIYLICYILNVIMLILNCFADVSPKECKYPKSENSWPEESYSFLSRITFTWMEILIWKGRKHLLRRSDLWELPPEDTADKILPIFETYWKKSLLNSKSFQEAKFNGDPEEVGLMRNEIVRLKSRVSILPALFKTFWPKFLVGGVFQLVFACFIFVNPQILKLLLSFIKNNEETWNGYFYAILLLFLNTVQTLVLAQYFNCMFIAGMRIRTALISSIYRKSLLISNEAKNEISIGEIVNLMTVDVQKIVEFVSYVQLIWSAPFQIFLALLFLWDLLGAAVLSGLAVMIILILINLFVAYKIKLLQTLQMKHKDDRIKVMNEVLNGVKVLKMYAWEPSFEKTIQDIRSKEIKILKQIAVFNAISSYIWSCASFLVSMFSFGTYILLNEKNVLNPEIIFVSLSLFNTLQYPLNMLPTIISNIIQTLVSIKRINKFMNAQEINNYDICHDINEKSPLIIKGGSFNWNKKSEKTVLTDLNLSFKRGELIAVVGIIGSGKSSLISAILGEMNKVSGKVNINGKIAYVPQQAWILNMSLRDNILFGKTYDSNLYYKILESCDLLDDISALPNKDQTEIGEKGVNLSGGQKQRIGIARAVYLDADIYLLDDPLSAVDNHVGKNIFEKVIGNNGLLKNKTRILVTHSVSVLPSVDRIIVLKNGRVSEDGTYQQLLDDKGAFAEFLMNYKSETNYIEDENYEVYHDSQITSNISVKQGANSDVNLLRKCEGNEKLINDEKMEKGQVNWSVYKHYLKAVGIFSALTAVIMNVIFQLLSAGSNFWLSVWSEKNELSSNISTSLANEQMYYLKVYGVFGIFQSISMLLSSVFLFLGTLHAAYILHTKLLFNVLRASCNLFFDITPIGRILDRFSKDVDVLDTVLPQNVKSFISTFLTVMATLLVISFITPMFIAIAIPLGVIYFFIQSVFIASSIQLKRMQSISRAPIYSHFSETLAGTSSIRAYSVQERFIKQNEQKVYENLVYYYPSIISNRWLGIRLEMIGNLVVFFAALFAVIERNGKAGLVGLSISYAFQITQGLNWLVRMVSDLETNIVNVERIKEYDEIPKEAAWEITEKSLPEHWPEHGSIDFKNCKVKYRPNLDFVLKDVSFSIKNNEKVGVVGRTGAGKSSLALTLFRIVELDEGQILIDDVNIANIGLHKLRSRLTLIPQDPILFSGTIRKNLDPFDHFSDEEIWKSLENAHLQSFVKDLPEGISYEIQQSGVNLSVGQRQLICLSRALLRKTKVLVLDEATAAVDLETDDLIQKTIKTEFKDCTVITIAHRLNTILDYDKVIVLDRGCVAEFGIPSDLLLNTNSLFYELAKNGGVI